jgi:hypothetical protein
VIQWPSVGIGPTLFLGFSFTEILYSSKISRKSSKFLKFTYFGRKFRKNTKYFFVESF